MQIQSASEIPDPPSTATDEYEIVVEGELDSSWSDWLAGFAITPLENGATLLAGAVVDQAALHGLLARIRDMNLKLISVARAPADHQATGRGQGRTEPRFPLQ